MQKFEIYPELYEKQLIFHYTPAIRRLYGGQKGGGKSYAMRAECVSQSLTAPGLRGLVLRRTFPEVKENMIDPMQRELPSQNTGYYKYNINDGIFTFYNGSTIRFSYCRNMQDVLRYQGIEYDWICIEELTHWQEEEFKILMNCLRSTRPGVIPNFFGSTNPWGVGHEWVKRVWIDRDFLPEENPDDYAFIPASVFDNRHLIKNDPAYLKNLKSLPEKLRKAYLYGSWDIIDGQFFTEWRPDLHVCKPFDIPESWKKVAALDYGYSNPTSILWIAQDPTDGTVYVYRQRRDTKWLYGDVLDNLQESTGKEKLYATLADPALRVKSADTGTSFFDLATLRRMNIIPANNDRKSGAQLIRQLLKPYSEPHPNGAKAGLQVFETCESLIRTLPKLVHDKVEVEDVDTKGDDHDFDALKYWLQEIVQKTANMQDVKELNKKARKRKDPPILGEKF